MNRRELFTVGGAGVAGLLFPQKTISSSSVRPVLEGWTDDEMGQKIADFPQGPKAYLEALHQEITKPWGPPFLRRAWRIILREKNWVYPVHSSWLVSSWDSGVKIHNTVFSVVDPQTEIIDISLLEQIIIYSPSMCEYSRITGTNGFGWFTLSGGVNDG